MRNVISHDKVLPRECVHVKTVVLRVMSMTPLKNPFVER